MLGGIVTTVDATNGLSTIEKHKECEKQVAVADRIVITKTDIKNIEISRKVIDSLMARLSELNPTAQLCERHDKSFKFHNLFDTSLYNPISKTINVRKWLNAEAFPSMVTIIIITIMGTIGKQQNKPGDSINMMYRVMVKTSDLSP